MVLFREYRLEGNTIFFISELSDYEHKEGFNPLHLSEVLIGEEEERVLLVRESYNERSVYFDLSEIARIVSCSLVRYSITSLREKTTKEQFFYAEEGVRDKVFRSKDRLLALMSKFTKKVVAGKDVILLTLLYPEEQGLEVLEGAADLWGLKKPYSAPGFIFSCNLGERDVSYTDLGRQTIEVVFQDMIKKAMKTNKKYISEHFFYNSLLVLNPHLF